MTFPLRHQKYRIFGDLKGLLTFIFSGDYVNFVTISIWDEAFGLVLALVVFTSTIKLIKLLKFNKRMGIMGDTIRLAAKDLKPFIIMFLVYFFAFCMVCFPQILHHFIGCQRCIGGVDRDITISRNGV